MRRVQLSVIIARNVFIGPEAMIEFNNVSVVYPNGVQALKDVDLCIPQGDFLFVVGPTGSGKSTLLKLIYREEKPASGRVVVLGKDVAKMKPREVPYLRRQIGVVFQDFKLLPQKTVYENIAFALRVIGASLREIHRRIPEMLDLVSLSHKADSFPHELSGGEQQRASIARALINRPPILLADEPTGNLDPDTSLELMKLLEIVNQRGTTVVVASHDQHIVDMMRKRVVQLHAGTTVRDDLEGKYRCEFSEPGVSAF